MKGNTSVLPFYTDISLQNHRMSYAYGQTYPLYVETGFLPPFQIIRTSGVGNEVTSAFLFTIDGVLVENLFTNLLDTGLTIKDCGEYDVIVYPAWLYLGHSIPEGRYYLRIAAGAQQWFSDVFTVVGDISPFLKIEWWDDEDFIFQGGRIVYQYDTSGNKFKNRLYFDTELGKPDYEFEEEGETRDGIFFPEKQISEKVYKCTVLAPEYLLDVMRLIRMADHVRITDNYGRVYTSDTFLITPKWEVQGDLASVEIEFRTDCIMKKLPYVKLLPLEVKGDFNDDFNNDYDITD